jgi:serine/threonine protein kinase
MHTEIWNRQTVSAAVNNWLIVVLYYPPTKLWKIADFGLTSEAVSGVAVTTKYSRGTAGYRAPELLDEYSKYTSKVDMGTRVYSLRTIG